MDKASVRKTVLNSLKTIENRGERNLKITKAAESALSGAEMVFIYISVGHEADTVKLCENLLAKGVKLCIPKIISKSEMIPVALKDMGELVPDKFGIPSAPNGAEEIPIEQIDFAVIPGVAFTKDGKRLGRGGGYYDRFLSVSKCKKIGICYNEQVFCDLPTDPHDVLMDLVITG